MINQKPYQKKIREIATWEIRKNGTSAGGFSLSDSQFEAIFKVVEREKKEAFGLGRIDAFREVYTDELKTKEGK